MSNYAPGDIVNGHQLNEAGTEWVPVAPTASPSPPAPPTQPQVVYVEKKSNGLATASLVLGILAAVASFVPILGMIAVPLAVVAIGLGIPALLKARKARSGKGKAIAGLVLAAGSVVMTFMVTGATVSAVDAAVDEIDAAVSEIGTTADEIDVTLGTPTTSDLGTTTLPVTIVNIGATDESPMVTIAATSADGSEQYDTTLVVVADLAPGQTANQEAQFFVDIPAGADFSVVDVS